MVEAAALRFAADADAALKAGNISMARGAAEVSQVRLLPAARPAS